MFMKLSGYVLIVINQVPLKLILDLVGYGEDIA